MQTAHVMVNIGGDNGNQVPKDVTAAETAVLIAIHGDEAVQDVSPTGEIDRTNRDELARLRGIYGRATDGESNRIIDQLFPGAGARVFETLEELGLPEKVYKALTRASASPVAAEVAPVKTPAAELGVHDMSVAQLKSYAAAKGIDLGDATKKADIVSVIDTATIKADAAARGMEAGSNPATIAAALQADDAAALADDETDGVREMADAAGDKLFA